MSYNPAVQSVIGEMQYGKGRKQAPVMEQATAPQIISEEVDNLVLEVMSEQPSTFVFEGSVGDQSASFVIEDDAEGFIDLGGGWCLIEDADTGEWEAVNEATILAGLNLLIEAEGDSPTGQQAQAVQQEGTKKPGFLRRAWGWIKKSLGALKDRLSDFIPDQKIKRMARLNAKDPDKAKSMMLKRLTKQHGAEKAKQMLPGAMKSVQQYHDNKQAFYKAVKGVKSGRPAPEHMAVIQGLNDQAQKHDQAVASGQDPKQAMNDIMSQHGTADQLMKGQAPGQQGSEAGVGVNVSVQGGQPQAGQQPAQPAQGQQQPTPAQQQVSDPQAGQQPAPADPNAQAGGEQPPAAGTETGEQAPPADQPTGQEGAPADPAAGQQAPSKADRRAMSKAATPSQGQQAMQQAQSGSFNVSGEGQATTGQDASGKPIVTTVPIKMAVNGQGLGSMIQTLMAQNFITAKTDKGHQQVTPTKLTIDGDGKKITIQNSKGSGAPGKTMGTDAESGNWRAGVPQAQSNTPIQKVEDGQAMDANAQDLWAQAKAQSPNNKIKAGEIYKQLRKRQLAAQAQQ